MSVNIRISIPVDDGAFDRYYAKFNAYLNDLQGLPESWKSLKDEAAQMQQHLGQAAQALALLAEGTNRMVDDAGKLRDQSDKTSRHWGRMARDTLGVAKNIGEATTSLLKWVGITSLIGGLVGGGTLYGIDRLAGGVATRRSQALGLGTTYGGLASFRTNFGRLGDAEGILGRVNEATLDPSKQVGLQALGLGNADLNGDTADAAAKAVEGLGRLVDTLDPRTLIPQLEARGVTDIFSIEEALRLKRMSPDERRSLQRGFRADRAAMDLDPSTQKRWQDFTTQMHRASVKIENVFVRGLVHLEPGLLKLSDSITKMIDNLGDSPAVKHWLDELGDGLDWLAKNMNTPEFRDKLSHFIDQLVHAAKVAASLAGAILKTIGWFGSMVGVTPAQAAAPAGADASRGMGDGPSGTGITSQGQPQAQRGASQRRLLGWASSGSSGSDAGAGEGFNTRGVRNMNPGNIGYGPFAVSQGSTGSAGTDTGHGVAVFPSYESGYSAMDALLQKRYGQGRHSAEEIIAAEGGWTPGNHDAAANVARSMGVDPNADVHLNDTAQRRKFEHGLMVQELGPKGAAYYESQLKNNRQAYVTINKNPGANPATINNAMVPQQ